MAPPLFEMFIEDERSDLIERLNPEKGIARNTALKENLLIMYVSILNKIPLIITGTPGSSKTVSINIIINSMKGNNSEDPFL